MHQYMYYSNYFPSVLCFPPTCYRSESAGAEGKLYNHSSKEHNTQEGLHIVPFF